jgi:hypothetical protein
MITPALWEVACQVRYACHENALYPDDPSGVAVRRLDAAMDAGDEVAIREALAAAQASLRSWSIFEGDQSGCALRAIAAVFSEGSTR